MMLLPSRSFLQRMTQAGCADVEGRCIQRIPIVALCLRRMWPPGRGSRPRPGNAYAASTSIGISRLSSSYRNPQTIAAMPRRAACGLAPLASHRAMNWGGTSTSRTLDGWNGLGLDMTALRFARQPLWPPLASPNRIARRRVKVCAATRPDLDAPSTMRHWDDNGGTHHTPSAQVFAFRRAHKPKASCAMMLRRSWATRRRCMTLRLCTLRIRLADINYESHPSPAWCASPRRYHQAPLANDEEEY